MCGIAFLAVKCCFIVVVYPQLDGHPQTGDLSQINSHTAKGLDMIIIDYN